MRAFISTSECMLLHAVTKGSVCQTLSDALIRSMLVADLGPRLRLRLGSHWGWWGRGRAGGELCQGSYENQNQASHRREHLQTSQVGIPDRSRQDCQLVEGRPDVFIFARSGSVWFYSSTSQFTVLAVLQRDPTRG